MKLRQAFTDFIFATNTDGSGKAASYVRALDMLGPILTKHYPNPIIGGSMWHGFSLMDIHALHKWICAEMKKGAASPVLADFESPKNFCSVEVAELSVLWYNILILFTERMSSESTEEMRHPIQLLATWQGAGCRMPYACCHSCQVR